MRRPQPIAVFPLIFILHFNVSLAMSTITAMSKDQIACTMCSACDNPCQPILSPPPPSPPPPSSVSNCPPPPSQPGSASYYYSPPPPLPPSFPTFQYYSPPPPSSSGGGAYYPPPNYYNYPTPPPPNPIVPYFPFYYYNPPPSSFVSISVQLAIHPIVDDQMSGGEKCQEEEEKVEEIFAGERKSSD